jgi:hypothetical protein
LAGVTDADCVDADPGPFVLIAETRNTYEVPLVRPVTVYVVPVDPVSADSTAQVPLP